MNGELLIGRQGVGAEAEVAGDEAGVQEGVAEREEDSHIAPLIGAVAHEGAFAVAHRPFSPREFRKSEHDRSERTQRHKQHTNRTNAYAP